MSFALIFLIELACIIHVIRTGRPFYWVYILILAPLIGVLAYIIVELLPAMMGSKTARNAQRKLATTVDPDKDYRRLKDQLALSDTIANRIALARECASLHKYDEALALYDAILSSSQGDEPIFCMDKAQIELNAGRAQRAAQTLNELATRWPDYSSPTLSLLKAMVFEENGQFNEAIAVYRHLTTSSSGSIESQMRLSRLLRAQGQSEESRAIAQQVLLQQRTSPAYAVKNQKEWFALAKTLARD